jgi:hypothetical protein
MALLSKRVKVDGTIAVAVRCRQCGEKYYYKLTRTARGEGQSVRQARANAKQRLRRMLEYGIEAVPCPHCGWFQKKMVPLLHRRRLTGLRAYGVAALIVGGVVAAVAAAFLDTYLDHGDGNALRAGLALLRVAAVPLLAGVVLLLVRYRKNAAYDANDPETEQERIELGRQLGITREQAEELMEQQDD